jgi:hypothetical protein
MLKKFDAVEYLVKKYVEDENHATIPIIFKDTEKMFNEYDPTRTSLAPEVYTYLDKCSYNLPVEYKIIIDVVSDNIDEKTKVRFSDAVKHHYGLKVFDNNIDLRAISRKSNILGILGLLFVLFVYLGDLIRPGSMVAGTTVNILREILTVTGWLFIWSAIEAIVFDRRELKTRRNENIQMFNAKFIFETESEYYKILEKEQAESVEKNEEYEEIRESFLEQ